MIAASIVGPQLIVALFSPWVGEKARTWGRRPLLLAAFAALPLRGFLFAVVTNPLLLVLVQLLDGVTAAVFAVLVPLVIADATRGTGHFNLGQGVVGTTVGIGASMSPTYAGWLSDHYSSQTAFLGLTAIAALGFVTTWLLMPETKPAPKWQWPGNHPGP
jgi:MFS family permease